MAKSKPNKVAVSSHNMMHQRLMKKGGGKCPECGAMMKGK